MRPRPSEFSFALCVNWVMAGEVFFFLCSCHLDMPGDVWALGQRLYSCGMFELVQAGEAAVFCEQSSWYAIGVVFMSSPSLLLQFLGVS